jgi:penicillin-insensitive murein endopeptidase
LVKRAAQDPRTTRIFIFPGAKVEMCRTETGDRSWLGKVRPWWGHHEHFHIRIACPRGARACVDQSPPPPAPRRDLTMADLPQQCAAILASP